MAGVELATAYYSLIPSMAGTASAVRQQSGGLVGVWNGIGDDAGKGVKTGLIGGVVAAGAGIVAGIATLGIGNLIRDAVTGLSDSVNIAGDLYETKSALDQVFGAESARAFETWSSRGAAELGQSKLAALQAAQSFGVYGKAAGLAGADLFDFSTDLASLGTDLASFFNTSPEEAIQAIGAGLRGESEPLRRFGVLLDDATLRAQAMAMGIYDGNGSLTQQQRVLAAQAAIFAQSADAQGDFARTSGGLANQQKILAGNIEDVKGKLGEALLPAMTMATAFANETMVPILRDLATTVGPLLGTAIEKAAPAFGDLLTAMAPLIPELVKIGSELLPPLLDIFIAMSPVMIDWARSTADMLAVASAFFGLLGGDTTMAKFAATLGAAGGSSIEFAQMVGTAVGAINSFFTQMAYNVGAAINSAVSFVQGMPGAVLGVFAGVGTWLVSSGEDLIGGFVDGIRSMTGAVGDAVAGVLEFAAGFFPNSPAKRGPFSGSGWTAVESGGAALMAQFASGFESRALTPTIGAAASSVAAAMVARAPSVHMQEPAGRRLEDTMTIQLLREIRDRVGITVPIPAVQGALGSRNVANSVRGA